MILTILFWTVIVILGLLDLEIFIRILRQPNYHRVSLAVLFFVCSGFLAAAVVLGEWMPLLAGISVYSGYYILNKISDTQTASLSRKLDDIYDRCVDENVQFTVYRPNPIRPGIWYQMLAFAHLSERPSDVKDSDLDPVEQVKKEAEMVLGERAGDYKDITQDSRQAVPREGELTFVPFIDGIEFNPPRRSFFWKETVHREEFRLRADTKMDGKIARGRLSVFLGSILLAEVTLIIRVDSKLKSQSMNKPVKIDTTPRYRKIFASYSHKDTVIVEQVENFVEATGDRYYRDCNSLRAGEVWSENLAQMIQDADVFQLFWSSNSMASKYVKAEWQHALSLNRPNFIRPTYWEEPLPEDPEKNLPPEELRRLHFQNIRKCLDKSEKAAPTTQAKDTQLHREEQMAKEEDISGPIQTSSSRKAPNMAAAYIPQYRQPEISSQSPDMSVSPYFRRSEGRFEGSEPSYRYSPVKTGYNIKRLFVALLAIIGIVVVIVILLLKYLF